MKKITTLLSVLFIAVIVLAFNKGEEYKTIGIGEKAPMLDYEMKGTNEKNATLKDIKKAHGTLVIFSCNTCPFVIAWEDRYPGLAKLSNDAEVGFALINSNEAKRSGADSMEEMIAHAKQKGYSDIPYLVDNNSSLANAFGAKTTPHVFLFDKDWKLVYEGAIDDNHKSAADANAQYLNDALKNLKQGKKIDPNNTKAIGCSIKRVKI